MWKAVVDSSVKPVRVMLGLSFQNVEVLKQDAPILFNLESLGLENHWVSIAYKHEDGQAAFPKFLSDKGIKATGIAFGDKALKVMESTPQVLNGPEFTFVVFVAESESVIEKMVRDAGAIGPDTIVTRTGYPPTDVPPSEN